MGQFSLASLAGGIDVADHFQAGHGEGFGRSAVQGEGSEFQGGKSSLKRPVAPSPCLPYLVRLSGVLWPDCGYGP